MNDKVSIRNIHVNLIEPSLKILLQAAKSIGRAHISRASRLFARGQSDFPAIDVTSVPDSGLSQLFQRRRSEGRPGLRGRLKLIHVTRVSYTPQLL